MYGIYAEAEKLFRPKPPLPPPAPANRKIREDRWTPEPENKIEMISEKEMKELLQKAGFHNGIGPYTAQGNLNNFYTLFRLIKERK